MNLGKTYFDIEGTTGNFMTNDVLSLSYINTAPDDKEIEKHTYFVRPRKSRIYQVDALLVNNFDPFEAEKHKLSNFQFTKELNKKFIEIGNKGSYFTTWHGYGYDYLSVSHHLFSNLFIWPWIFSTGGARQLDLLPIARNLDYYDPDKIRTERNEKNNKVWKLTSFCKSQNFPITKAHSSEADTEGLRKATVFLQSKFPDLFKECLKHTNKNSVLPSIKDKDVFIFPETFFAKTRNFAGSFITNHKFYKGYYIVADLKHDWEKLMMKKGKEFSREILSAPKKIRQIKSNRNPLIKDKSILKTMTDKFSEELKEIGLPELEKRGNFILKNREEIAQKIDLVIEDQMEEKTDQSEKSPEELIFDLNPLREEKDMMQNFVEEKTSMEEQKKIVKAFKKPALKHLAEIILFEEYDKAAFDQKEYKKIRKRVAEKLLSTSTEKFPTIPEQFARIDSLRAEMEENGAEKRKIDQVANINKHLEKTAQEHEKYL
tara:strand:+ start:52 stop:1512 length:1461 start_codon:yes stop_codon:yes gene_type:complete